MHNLSFYCTAKSFHKEENYGPLLGKLLQCMGRNMPVVENLHLIIVLEIDISKRYNEEK